MAGEDDRPRALRLVADAQHAGRRLDDVAVEWLTAVLGSAPTRAAVRRLIMAGALRLRGRPLRAPFALVERGAVLDLLLRPGLVRRRTGPAALDAARILYEDDALIAVDKPPGLPTVATADPSRPHLVGLVERLLAAREGAGPSRPLGVHQRLDRDTSGVVLLVKDPSANAGLAAQLGARAVEKTYLALTRSPEGGACPRHWRADAEVDGEAGRDPRTAVTDFEVLEVLPRGLLVQARPRTGRKHQVRIHLAQAGLPILGDVTYGGDASGVPRVMLHAARLALEHPLTGDPLSLTSPMPDDFRTALDGLRRTHRRVQGGRRRR